MAAQAVLVDGAWVESEGTQTFQATNPATSETLPDVYPVSTWPEIERTLTAAAQAFEECMGWPGDRFGEFLESYADEIETRADALVEAANLETALPVSPRLKDVELPRTTNQLRQAACAARAASWTEPVIDTNAGIRSVYGPLGPVAVFGPNNFPFAFNSIAGGDFAAAVAAGCPVIAKGHSSHPTTTRLFAEAAHAASNSTGMPRAFVQLIYRTSHEDGAKLVSHPALGATGYTGSRSAGLVLKEAADRAGKPIYLELSSINPVFVLPGVLAERAESLAEEFTTSCLMGAGQFCTNPGLVVLPAAAGGKEFAQAVAERFEKAPAGTMLSEGVRKSFAEGVKALQNAGAEIATGGDAAEKDRVSFQNTLLTVTGDAFLENSEALQAEAFGNGSLMVLANDTAQMAEIAKVLEGNLTGCIYSAANGSDDEAYDHIAVHLRRRVGRLLNDKMPTGVAVSAAMNHGGPFPATGHPGFTAVGLPGAIRRFGMLKCYDNVRPHRLPLILQDDNPNQAWRCIDGAWTQGKVE